MKSNTPNNDTVKLLVAKHKLKAEEKEKELQKKQEVQTE